MESKLSRDKLNILIELFIIKGSTFAWSPADFGRESRMAKILMKSYPDFDFFYTLTDIQNKFNSLCGLAGKYYKPRLQERYKNFVLEKSKKREYILSEEAVIDIKLENKGPRNVLEFLRN